MAKMKIEKKEGVKKRTSIGTSRRSRNKSNNKSAGSNAKRYRGQG